MTGVLLDNFKNATKPCILARFTQPAFATEAKGFWLKKKAGDCNQERLDGDHHPPTCVLSGAIVDWMMMMIATTDMPMMTVAMAFIHDSFALCKIFVAGKQLKFLEPHGFILLWTGPSWMIIEQTCLALRVISSCVVTQNK